MRLSINASDVVSRHMSPVRPSDVQNDFVEMINFYIHLCWILALWMTTWSVLAYYRRVFDNMINSRKAEMSLLIPSILVPVWAISSVGNRSASDLGAL